MSKIYNNLNIENLIRTEEFKSFSKERKKEIITRTELFNQFNEEQQEEIRKGLEENLDISWYAKKEFEEYYMWKIRTGLEDNLDPLWYAKPEISPGLMFDRRKLPKLKKNS